MKVFQKSRPSPAMIVAVIALSFALVGSAVAGTDGLSRAVTKSKVKKISKKQANKRITAREASLNVNSALTADNATSADSAASSDAPFAYAHVTEARTVDASRSKGLSSANILLSATGIICFEIPFDYTTVQATQNSGGATVDAIVNLSVISEPPFPGCPGGTDLTTFSTNVGTGATNDEDFDIWFGN